MASPYSFERSVGAGELWWADQLGHVVACGYLWLLFTGLRGRRGDSTVTDATSLGQRAQVSSALVTRAVTLIAIDFETKTDWRTEFRCHMLEHLQST